VEDNDDTLATFAHDYNALIMSNDKDFFRYLPEVPGIIQNYEMDKDGYINFIYK
jgi:hypothetical protein